MAHPNCHGPRGHVCQEPSIPPRACIERGCPEEAGTLWGPLWCPRHDEERLERVTAELKALELELDALPVNPELLHGADRNRDVATPVPTAPRIV